MYRSYTLNSYLQSLMNGDQAKNQSHQSSNKHHGLGLSHQDSVTKKDSKGDNINNNNNNNNNKQSTKTMHSSFIATPSKAEQGFQEPIRYLKSSSIGTYSSSDSKSQTHEPSKHQILGSSNYQKYSSDTKTHVYQPTRQPINLATAVKLGADNNKVLQASKPQSVTATQSITTPSITTSSTTTPIKLINPEAKTFNTQTKTQTQPQPQPQHQPQSQHQPQPQPQPQISTPAPVQKEQPQPQVQNEPKLGIEKKASINAQQSNLFSEFKLKYDELKMNYDRMRQELDEVTREKKKLQIKFLNANPEYYEKQIKRLKGEVEKYQEENEDHKYKYWQAENAKKQYEASFKVKQEELRVIIKQLQKQKINNVELKHQNDEKDRVFGRIKMQFERSNESTLKNYDEAVAKANRLDGALKTRNAQYDQLTKSLQRTQRKLTQTKQQYKKYKEQTEQKLKTLTKTTESKTTEYLKTKSELSTKIDQFQQQIQKYKQERVSADLLKTRKSQEVCIVRANRELEVQVVRLEERVRLLEFQLVRKDQVVVELQKTVERFKGEDQVRELEGRVGVLEEEKMDIIRENQRIKGQLHRQIDMLRLQLMRAPEKIVHSSTTTNFQQILRIQLQQNSNLKRQLSHKIDEVYNLKSDIDELKVQKQNLLSQMQVLKKIKKSEQKNVKIQAEIASQHVKNDIQSYKRKIQLLEVKVGLKAKEVKEKDAFIMNSVLGRCKQEEAPLILADFQRIFEANYVEKIAEANQRIQDLLQPKK